MAVRGVRGATTASEDTAEAILAATRGLLLAMLQANPELRAEDIASAFFTVTDDLRAAFPAQAARQLGWTETPLLCAQEIPAPGSPERCIRVLLLWNTRLRQKQVRHVYLGEAAKLRPDLSQPG